MRHKLKHEVMHVRWNYLGYVSVASVAKNSDNIVSRTELASHFDRCAGIEGSCWSNKQCIIPEQKVTHLQKLLVAACMQ
jgi:hypothetical protein